MFRVLYCTLFEHNLLLLSVAAAVCLSSMTVAAGVCAHLRTVASGRRAAWVATLGLVVGGGAWSTHFIAMLAYTPPMPIGFDLTWTLASLALGGVGAWRAYRRVVRATPNDQTHSIKIGLSLGLTIATLHFVGMLGIQAGATRIWAWDLVAWSCVVCIGFCIIGARASVRARNLAHQLGAHAWFAAAIVSLHFTAMGALTLSPDPRLLAGASLDAGGVATIVTTTMVATLLTVTLLTLADQRLILAEAQSQAKSQFLATMSHELRTPLTSIISYAELIAETAEDDGRLTDQADAKVIVSASKHLLTLISEILDFSKLEANQMALSSNTFAVAGLIANVVHTAAPLIAANNNKFEVQAEHCPTLMNSDEFRLRQCVLNLLSNAGKFTSNGVITLRAYAQTRKGVEGIALEIEDTGVGMPSTVLERLFQPFTQADETISRTYGGTGLGLAITKELVSKLGGTISADSQEGAGSMFRIWAPLGVPARRQESPPLGHAIAAGALT